MKKRWVYVVLIFAVLVIILFNIRYKTKLDFRDMIPVNAKQVLHVNLRQLEKDVVLDILAHPLKYILKKDKKRPAINKKIKLFGKGITIPKNIVFYTTDSGQAWRSNTIALNDSEILTKMLLKEGFIETSKTNLTLYSMKKINFVFSETELVILFSEMSVDMDYNMLFSPEAYLSPKDDLITTLKQSRADVSFVNTNGSFIEANFAKGSFLVDGDLGKEFNGLIANDHLINDDQLLVLVTKSPNQTITNSFISKFKDGFKKNIHLSLDSIVDGSNGNIKVQLASIVRKSETIITYDYDDDFNRIETKSIQEVTVPNMTIDLGQKDSSNVFQYFLDKNVIQTIDNELLFTSIPIYKFTAEKEKNNISLRSGKRNSSGSMRNTKLYSFFKAKEYFDNPLEIPIPNYLEDFLKMTRLIHTEISNTNQLSARIDLVNPYRNFLGQMIRP